MKTVLGIDPGTAVTGYGVVSPREDGSFSLLECGVIRTSSTEPLPLRIREIFQGIQEIIGELAATGISILITDHAAREILQITNRTYVVSEGRILVSGTTSQIVQHDEVKQKYLGEIEISQSAGASEAEARNAFDALVGRRDEGGAV